jgi:hypothetical protein
MHSSRNCGRYGSPSLLPHHIGWINVVDMWAQSPLTVSGTLLGLNSERPRCLACHALSQVWVLNNRFGFPLWYK